MLNKFENLTSYFKKNEILAIDLSNEVVRAVVVKKEAKEVVVLSTAEVSKSPPSTPFARGEALDNPQSKELLERLGNYPKQAVLVSPEVKLLTAELPIPSNRKLALDKLQEAVRWEAQAYLDFPAPDGLFGYQLQTTNSSIKEEFFKNVDRTGKTTPILITAISRQEYSRLAESCKRQYINLQAVYPKESIFSIGFFLKGLKIGPQYAPAVEAALQELKVIGSGKLGINDRIPLVKRLKVRIHVFPLVTVAIFALGFLIHYAYIKFSFWQYSSRIEKLKVQKTKLSANISAFKDFKSQIGNTYEKKRYIENLSAKNEHLLDLFIGIIKRIPYDVILDRIAQDGDGSNTFLLEGSGVSAASITKFVGELERLEVIQEAKLQSINEKEVTPESEGLFLYGFKIKVVLKENG